METLQFSLLEAQIPINFDIGDRVTPVSKNLGFGRYGHVGTITEKRYDKRKGITWMTVFWDDGQIESCHVEGAKCLKKVESNTDYISQFKVGDRIRFRDGYRTNWDKELTIGTIDRVSEYDFHVFWDNYEYAHFYTKHHIRVSKWWEKVIDDPISGISSEIENIPENTLNLRKHGTIEDYLAKGKNGKHYKYQRYVYLDAKGIYRHHHISQKQTEAITALWHSGASAKEIVTAIGKKYLGKDSP